MSMSCHVKDWSGHIKIGASRDQVRSGHVRTDQVRTIQIMSGQSKSGQC